MKKLLSLNTCYKVMHDYTTTVVVLITHLGLTKFKYGLEWVTTCLVQLSHMSSRVDRTGLHGRATI